MCLAYYVHCDSLIQRVPLFLPNKYESIQSGKSRFCGEHENNSHPRIVETKRTASMSFSLTSATTLQQMEGHPFSRDGAIGIDCSGNLDDIVKWTRRLKSSDITAIRFHAVRSGHEARKNRRVVEWIVDLLKTNSNIKSLLVSPP